MNGSESPKVGLLSQVFGDPRVSEVGDETPYVGLSGPNQVFQRLAIARSRSRCQVFDWLGLAHTLGILADPEAGNQIP